MKREDATSDEFILTPVELALIDDLTKLPNRRGLDRRFAHEIEWVRRHRSFVAFLMIDPDHLTQVNDTYGRLNGDAVLAGLASILVTCARNWDVVARYGSDEFAFLLRGSEPAARMRAERIRASVAAATFPGGLKLTVSVGLAATDEAALFAGLIDRAEQALSGAKRRGGNQVMVSDIAVSTLPPTAATSRIDNATPTATSGVKSSPTPDRSIAGSSAGRVNLNTQTPDVGVQGWMVGVPDAKSAPAVSASALATPIGVKKVPVGSLRWWLAVIFLLGGVIWVVWFFASGSNCSQWRNSTYQPNPANYTLETKTCIY